MSERCDIFSHDWQEEYHGHRCSRCDLFYIHGLAPWEYDPEEEERIAREEYYFTHGTCEICFGEYGDGWSNCECDDQPKCNKTKLLFVLE